ncbi:hypothetical protein H4S06_005695, partial [Coemansia sp. BCRC 34490]
MANLSQKTSGASAEADKRGSPDTLSEVQNEKMHNDYVDKADELPFQSSNDEKDEGTQTAGKEEAAVPVPVLKLFR